MLSDRDIIFNITAKADRVESELRTLQAAFGRLERVTQASNQTLRTHNATAAQTANSLKTASTATASLTSSLSIGMGKLAGLAAGYATLATAIAAAKGVMNAGMGAERLERSFQAIAGSAAEGKVELDFVRTAANRLGVDFVKLAESYKGISAASQGTTLAGQKTRDIFLAIAEAGRALGLSSEQVNGSLMAISQMISKGTVASEELRGQLGERLPGAFQITARAMGVTTAQLGKMLEAGSVLATDFVPKFAKQLQTDVVRGMNAAGGATLTAEQNFAKLRNEINEMAKGIAQSGILDWLGQMAGKLADVGRNAREAEARMKTFRTGESTRQLEARAGGPLRPDAAPQVGRLATVNQQIETAETALKSLETQADAQSKMGFWERFTKGASVDNFVGEIRTARAELEKLRQEKAFLIAQAPGLKMDPTKATQEDFQVRPELLEERTQLAVDLAAKSKTLGEEVTRIIAALEAMRVSLAPFKTSEEIVQEQRKFAEKEMDALRKQFPNMQTLPAPAPLAPVPAPQVTTGHLDPLAAERATLLVQRAAEAGIALRITSGVRTAEEQARLYAQGRTTPGAIVTNAPPGTSRHETGRAFDVVPLKGGQPDWESPHWNTIGKIGKDAGLTWGGDFKTFKDRPHFELPQTAPLTRAPVNQQSLIGLAAAQAQVDPLLIEAMAFRESSFNPRKESSAGAQGAMQLMPGTAAELGVKDPFDITESFRAGAEYFAKMLKQFGTETLALAAYNAGPGAVEAAGRDLTKLPQSTQTFVARVQETREQYRQAAPQMPMTPASAVVGINPQVQPLVDYMKNLEAAENDVVALRKAEEEHTKAVAENSAEIADLAKRFRETEAALKAGETGMDAHSRKLGLERLEAMNASVAILELARASDTRSKALEAEIDEMTNWSAKAKEIGQAPNLSETLMDIVRQTESRDAAGNLLPPIRAITDEPLEPAEGYPKSGLDLLKTDPTEKQRLQELEQGANRVIGVMGSLSEAILHGGDAWISFTQVALGELAKLLTESSSFRTAMQDIFTSVAQGIANMVKSLSSSGGDSTGAILGAVVKIAGAAAGGGGGGVGMGQHGGMITANQRMVVGEAGKELLQTATSLRLVGVRGPEIIRPTEAGMIIPHRETMTFLRKNALHLTPTMLEHAARQAKQSPLRTAAQAGIPLPSALRQSLLASGTDAYNSVVDHMAKRMDGGPVVAGNQYLTGEAGAELLMGAQAGRGGAGGKGPTTINVNLNLHGVQDAQSFVRSRAQVARAMRGIVDDGSQGMNR